MIYFTSLLLLALALMISSVDSSRSFSAHEYQTLVPASLPTRQTVEEEEALSSYSWDDNTENQPESINTTTTGFSVKLHHVDSLSPQDTSPKSLLNTRLERDTRRANMIFSMITKSSSSSSASAPGQFSSPVIPGGGEYFAIIGVGTPSRDFNLIMDSGSNLIWLQCQPCKKCYEQEGPIFDPKNSSSFHQVPCVSKICGGNDTTGYCRNHTKCPYYISYGDGSFTSGDIVTEMLTFGNSTKVHDVTLGCGNDNEGSYEAAAGLFGLGRDEDSFPSQAGRKFGNIFSFSYCLATRGVDSPGPSSLVFGDVSAAYGKAVVYTPLLTNPNPDFNTFYYVGLEGISVGGSRVRGIDASTFRIHPKTGRGGVIIDSGTAVTRLPKSAYVALRDAFKSGASNLTIASNFSIFDTCYDLSGETEVNVPTVELHFHGANVSLPASNYMITVDYNGTVCFAFAGTADSDGGLSIIGNIQQQGFGVVFDLAKKRVGFAENGCS